MMEKIIINISTKEEMLFYMDNNIHNFIVPLKDFCVGYKCMDYKYIGILPNKVYLLINRILTNDDLMKLKEILSNIENIKGIFFEDLGVLQLLEELNMDIERIYFPNHFATNHNSVNLFLEHNIDSIVLSNEITKEEVINIASKATKPVVVQVLGYNQIMYSRRNLISNFNDEYNLDIAKDSRIREINSQKCLQINENKYGTVIFDEKIYNNLELTNEINNTKYFYVNSSFLDPKLIIKVLEHIIALPNSSNGFLDKKTIYKVGDIHE